MGQSLGKTIWKLHTGMRNERIKKTKEEEARNRKREETDQGEKRRSKKSEERSEKENNTQAFVCEAENDHWNRYELLKFIIFFILIDFMKNEENVNDKIDWSNF